MSDHPAIGIFTGETMASHGAWTQPAALAPAAYGAAVRRAGGLALIVTPDPHVTRDPDELLDRLDGLILTGGNDVDPAAYAAEPEPQTGDTDPERDAFELALTRRAIERDMPVLAICRGMQVLNVAFGGTLIQDLPTRLGHSEHRRTLGSFENSEHDVRLAPGSLAARAAGELRHTTRSHHHQGVDEIGDGLEVTGTSVLDDLPEAVERSDRRFVLGVQWHPEADEHSRIIAALVTAAAGGARAAVERAADARAA